MKKETVAWLFLGGELTAKMMERKSFLLAALVYSLRSYAYLTAFLLLLKGLEHFFSTDQSFYIETALKYGPIVVTVIWMNGCFGRKNNLWVSIASTALVLVLGLAYYALLKFNFSDFLLGP